MEGDVVRIEINPLDADEVASASAEGHEAYLRHVPHGMPEGSVPRTPFS